MPRLIPGPRFSVPVRALSFATVRPRGQTLWVRNQAAAFKLKQPPPSFSKRLDFVLVDFGPVPGLSQGEDSIGPFDLTRKLPLCFNRVSAQGLGPFALTYYGPQMGRNGAPEPAGTGRLKPLKVAFSGAA